MDALLDRPFRFGITATLAVSIVVLLVMGSLVGAGIAALATLVSFVVLARGSGFSRLPGNGVRDLEDPQNLHRKLWGGATIWALVDGNGGHGTSGGGDGGYDGGGGGCGGGGD